MQAFGAWLLKVFLEWVFGKTKAAVEEEIEERKREAERTETNEQNTKKYEEAPTREERISAGENLLNGDRN